MKPATFAIKETIAAANIIRIGVGCWQVACRIDDSFYINDVAILHASCTFVQLQVTVIGSRLFLWHQQGVISLVFNAGLKGKGPLCLLATELAIQPYPRTLSW